MEIKYTYSFDNGSDNGCMTVKKLGHITVGNQKNEVSNELRPFTPLQFEGLKEFAPPLADIVNAIWTAEVKAAYKKSQHEIIEGLKI